MTNRPWRHRQGRSRLQTVQVGLGAESPETVRACLDLAELYRIAGKPADARPVAEEAWLRLSEDPSVEPALAARSQSELGAAMADLGELAEAEELLHAGFEGLVKALGPASPRTRSAGERLAALYDATRRPEEAGRVRELLIPSDD